MGDVGSRLPMARWAVVSSVVSSCVSMVMNCSCSKRISCSWSMRCWVTASCSRVSWREVSTALALARRAINKIMALTTP